MARTTSPITAARTAASTNRRRAVTSPCAGLSSSRPASTSATTATSKKLSAIG